MKPIFKSVLRMPSFKRYEDLTVAEIVEVVEEIEQSRISGISTNLISSKSSCNTQFQATKRWNKLITKFYEKMPKKKCWGLLVSYNDIFTGKEAIQFLLDNLFPEIVPNKPVDETNAIKFMEVLLKKNLVQNVKFPESQLFILKAIYRFNTVKIAEEIEATNLKRSNSISNFKATLKVSSTIQPTAASNRRISSSCSNLHALIKAESKIGSTKNPFKFSRTLKTTQEFAENEQEMIDKNDVENSYFMRQITCNRYSNPSIENEFLSTPSTSSSNTCSTNPSSTFSISTTISSSSRNVKRFAEFEASSGIPPKRFNRGFVQSYNRSSNECKTPSRAEELLLLLDSHIADEMLSESQRQKKLAAFRETYPQIYLLRFPEAAFTPKPKPRQATPIRVFKNFIRRTSAKRK